MKRSKNFSRVGSHRNLRESKGTSAHSRRSSRPKSGPDKIGALDTKLEAKSETADAKFATVVAKIDAVDSKVESFRRELLSEIRRVEEKFEVRLGARVEPRIVQ